MKITLLQVGKTTDSSISEVADLYSNRIKKYTAFEILTIADIRNTKNMPLAEQKKKEGEKILLVLASDDYVVLLDERGKELRTIELSKHLGKVFMLPKKRIVFVVGGPWGFSDEVYTRADFKLSLSKNI